MGLMSPGEFVESLKDDREVYMDGEKVEDVTSHPFFKSYIDTAAIDYEMAEDPEYKDLAVVHDPDLDEPISRYYKVPKNEEDLLKRHELMLEATRLGEGIIPYSHDIASDTLNALNITANSMGKEEYIKRVENYRNHLKKKDLSVAVAVTDAKGNRSLRPSSPDQAHPDYYVRIVDSDDEGITVRGAKLHISASAYFNEIIVIPGRNMTEEDKDYAVAFAIPANADGLKHVCHPQKANLTPSEFPREEPMKSHTDALLIFDDVFVPWERVFLAKEWQHTLTLVYNFAFFHRHTASTYRIPITENLLGMALAMAEYNGIENRSHVKEKITDLIIYLDTLKSLTRSACMDYTVHGGIAVPNPVTTNIAKYHLASNYHDCVKKVEDIAGGILATAPTYKDYQNPEIGEYVDKYLGGKAGIPTENRLRMIHLMRRWLTLYLEILAIHGEGSLQAQRRTIYAERKDETQKYKERVEKHAGIKKEENPD